MKLEQQVVSLDLAKRLKELGVEQDGLFYWKYSNGTLEKVSNIQIDTELVYGQQPVKPKTLGTWTTVSAFTVAELGEMLKNEEVELPTYLSSTKEWAIVYETTLISGASTEANARAKMLVYLLENNLTTPASQDKE